MDPITGSIISGVAGELVGGIFGSSSAKKQNKAAAEAQERANAFTKEQLQNRHQWEVADLKAAGLNPVLSAGGTPSIGGSQAAPVVGELDAAANSAKNLGKMRVERETAQAALDNVKLDNGKKQAETNATEEAAKLNRANTALKFVETNLLQKYGPAQAVAGILRDGSSAIGNINPFRFNKSESNVTSRSNNTSTSRSENHNYNYKGN